MHSVQISIRSDCCITTDIMRKHTENAEKMSKNRGLVPTIQPLPDFSWTCGFREVLEFNPQHDYEISENFNDLMPKYGKKYKNAPKMWAFPHSWPPRFFFKIRALSLLYHYGALTSCKRLEKTNKRSLRKTDQWTDKGNY